MNAIPEKLKVVRAFFDDVAQEMRKTSWPGRQELFESTVMVVISVLATGVFVGLCDKVLLELLRLLIPSG